MTKLIQLKLSEKKLKKYSRLVDMLGLSGTYGEYQKAIDFSIDLAISEIKKAEIVMPILKADKLRLFFSSVVKIRNKKELEKIKEKLKNNT